MNESLHLGRIGGTRVGINWSLLPVFALVAWGLAGSQLPYRAPGYTSRDYWVAGVLTTVAFFASLLAHELSHAAVARRHGLAVSGIVLWLFGGVARIEGDVSDHRSELAVAGVGPATSLVVAGIAGAGAWLTARTGVSPLAVASLGWLGLVNVMLGVFNLLPAFPLDGGRVLRALLWRRWGDRARATAVAAGAGRGIGFGLGGVGVIGFLAGMGGGGLWLALIGWFVAGAAAQQQRQPGAGAGLGRLTVGSAMSRDPVVVPVDATVEDVIGRYVLSSRFSSFPVGDRFTGRIVGLTTIARMRRVPPERRAATPITAASAGPGELVLCTPADGLAEVAARMAASADHRALVFDGGRLVGIVAPSDVAHAASHAGLSGPGSPTEPPAGLRL